MAALSLIPAVQAPARASVPPPAWMMKGQDIQPWAAPYPSVTCPAGDTCYQSIGLAQQAQNDGVTMPPVKWRLCGTWNGTVYGASDYTTCQAGDTLVVEDYYKLEQAISDGLFTSLGIHTALYDIESWSLTPSAQSSNPASWIVKTIQLGRANGVGCSSYEGSV